MTFLNAWWNLWIEWDDVVSRYILSLLQNNRISIYLFLMLD